MYRPDAYHGHRFKNFSKSSIFVPPEWEVKNTRSGFTNLIANVFKAIDRRIYPHEPHAYYGYPRHGNHGHGYYDHHSRHRYHDLSHSYYSQPSTVLISDDKHGMFSHSRVHMPFHRGYAHVSSKSVPTECPRCKKQIMTLVKQSPGAPHLIATVGAVALGLIFKAPKALLPIAMLPMQMKSLHPAVHYCPKCNFKLGKNVQIVVPTD
ncbi:hypothetical protein LPJ64_002412 [Coemansia asiatica]|uniref:LITAF domain-containing protein n=1 Tax=Coemansia asiatica TaxID=1052880 RepID=A0A9W7XN72_9FUNG|nr:hypothetical protein LPJ64_002412 [Coemansia asiatica]KAJ2879807.1 hypothetical protein FB639_002991 [Coemansia asiatica]